MRFVFEYKDGPERQFQVDADDLKAAQILLHLFLSVDDPFGRVIRPHHIPENFRLTDAPRSPINVNGELQKWGHL